MTAGNRTFYIMVRGLAGPVKLAAEIPVEIGAI
jgi:hypothetical protein